MNTTLKDTFALAAMQVILQGVVMPTPEAQREGMKIVAKLSYDMAEAMLAEKGLRDSKPCA